ncbi:ribose 1,5-bisphosphate isomerase [Candidatus Micrarchaeota archaeon CG10_big_fil_rev_8_21_14_0_10_59_7]|nr:MAG: ribose 1,5-bisphosphate isomerase [Candidatus Micrarchaeota archaeon CG10_big_fil_rev_8_21_14_0_10_59_7]
MVAVQKPLLKTYADIKALKIQGAEAVAAKSVNALSQEMGVSSAKTRKGFVKEMRAAVAFLKTSRPTEPALRNALRFMLLRAMESKETDVVALKQLVEQEAREYHENALRTKLRIAEYGARLVPKGASILVHCHSSTVMRVLKKAQDDGKKPKVFCTESRPLYQGRISAKELSDYGIDTTLVVDSAVSTVLRRMSDEDVVLVGADAITSEGDLINKIGTCNIASLAKEHGEAFYSCTGTHKFDPLTLWGESEKIEERSPDEVWKKKERPRKLRVLNPAFDVTPASCVTAFVTELGVVPPSSLIGLLWKRFGLEEEG